MKLIVVPTSYKIDFKKKSEKILKLYEVSKKWKISEDVTDIFTFL